MSLVVAVLVFAATVGLVTFLLICLAYVIGQIR